jgi:hypothetical protein
MLASTAILGVGGWAAMGADSPAPDFDKVVPRPPAEVYEAFASASPELEVTHPAEGDLPSVTIRVEREAGESLSYRVLFGETEAVSATIEFEPAGNGDSTRVTADLEVDQDEIRSFARRAGGDTAGVPRIPNALFDIAFRRQMNELTDRVARGESLSGITETGSAAWRGIGGRPDSDPQSAVAAERLERESRQDAAVRPMATTRPMIDPSPGAPGYRSGY